MNGRKVIQPSINGIQTVLKYLRRVQRNERRGQIVRPDASKLRLIPTQKELGDYSEEIVRLTQKSGLTCANAKIISEAARNVASRSDNLGTSESILTLRPGSDDPVHYGHVSAGLGAIMFLNMQGWSANGAVFATGGKVPDKPEISAFHHREAMTKLTLDAFSPWIMPTSIRNATAEDLGQAYIYMNGQRYSVIGETASLKRAYSDMAAFSWLFAMNPKVAWYYITGSDKINGYGKKNEEELVNNILHAHGVKVVYFERDDEPVDPKCVALQAWLQARWDQGMFLKSEVSSYSGLSATKLRGMLIKGDPNASYDMNASVIAYINENGLLDLYRLNDAVKIGHVTRGSEDYLKQIERLRTLKIID